MPALHHLMAVLLLGGVPAGAAMADTPTAGEAPAKAVPTNATTAGTMTNPAPAALEEDRNKLRPQDKLIYSIEDDPVKGTEAETVTVTPLYELHFRVSRGSDLYLSINASNRTFQEVRAELKAKLDADYYQNARVRLELTERAPLPVTSSTPTTPVRLGQIYFTGQTRSSSMPLAPGEPRRIYETIIQAGHTEWADLKRVKVTRILDPVTQKTEIMTIDLKAIEKGDRSKNIILQDGDIINIPEVKMFFR